MPRRPTPLDPDDGPTARFALALRELRDTAGFGAPTIKQIASLHHIPRSTLYAAMRGQRIPMVPVLAALVRSWGGDETYWMSLRTRTETEIEKNRRQQTELEKSDSHETAERHEDTTSAETRHEHLQELLRRPTEGVAHQLASIPAEDELTRNLLTQMRRDSERKRQELKPLIAELLPDAVKQQTTGTHPRQATPRPDADPALADVRERDKPKDSEQDPDAWDLQEQRFLPLMPQWLETVRTTLDADGPASRWQRMRDSAGQPSIRELATSTGLSFTTISELLYGTADHTKAADRLLLDLEERAKSIDLWLQYIPPRPRIDRPTPRYRSDQGLAGQLPDRAAEIASGGRDDGPSRRPYGRGTGSARQGGGNIS
ncbi:hypothetical protein [Streptomyces sp. NPDC001675]